MEVRDANFKFLTSCNPSRQDYSRYGGATMVISGGEIVTSLSQKSSKTVFISPTSLLRDQKRTRAIFLQFSTCFFDKGKLIIPRTFNLIPRP